MKTDVISLTNSGAGMDAALNEATAAAQYRGLNNKESLQVRLLAEEMLGMLREITGETKAQFWIESEGKEVQLHLTARPYMTGAMRKDLLSAATSGKNAAAVGVMGKLRDMIERVFEEPEELGQYGYYHQGMIFMSDADGLDHMTYSVSADVAMWSMNKYKDTVEAEKDTTEEAKEEWDELEKSIIANLADEVKVAIRGREVELIVYKKF